MLEPCVAGTEGDKPEAGRWEESEDEGLGKRLRPGQGLRSAGARGAGTLIPSAQRLVWAAKQPLGNAALGALFA